MNTGAIKHTHLTLPSVSLFSLSFFTLTVNHPPLRAHPRYLSLLQHGSLLRKVGCESGKKRKRRCHYTSKEGLQWGIERAGGVESERHQFIGIHASTI